MVSKVRIGDKGSVRRKRLMSRRHIVKPSVLFIPPCHLSTERQRCRWMWRKFIIVNAKLKNLRSIMKHRNLNARINRDVLLGVRSCYEFCVRNVYREENIFIDDFMRNPIDLVVEEEIPVVPMNSRCPSMKIENPICPPIIAENSVELSLGSNEKRPGEETGA